jgi:uncharacterized repeat protein (TIGR02543 family)
MWYTTLVGNPSVYNSNPNARVRFDGNGSNINLNDFAIIGCLNYRNDSEANDGFQGFYGTNSSIRRCWVEHTKVGCWIANSQGMLISDCRIRDTIADGINLSEGCNSCIVTNCATRGTGDDSFGIWPATYTTQTYSPGYNLITHCTAQVPFFANGCGIYGATDNGVQDSFFQDIPNGAGILIAGEFSIGTNGFAGTTVAQRCNLNRCGGNDPGWRWRGALTITPENNTVIGVNVNNLNISNSLSYGVQCLDNLITNASISSINVSGYALAVQPFHPQNVPGTNVYVDGVFGVLARSDAIGSLTISGLTINSSNITSYPYPGTNYPYPGTFITNEAGGNFTFTFLTTPINVTVQTIPAGYSFTADGVTYTNAQTFNWTQGSAHALATVSPQNAGAGAQDIWTSWSDGGAISHVIEPLESATYTANFTNQYYLTMNAGTGGSASPDSGWINSGTVENISATPATGYTFDGWTGSGSGSYSGGNNSASISMNGPITETANFSTPLVNSMAWLQQPGNVLQGAVILPEVQVLAIGANGQPLAGAGITLSLGSGTGTLSGTLTRITDTNGIALFNDLSVNQPGPKTLTAAALTGSASPTNSTSFMAIGSVAALAFTAQPGAAFADVRFGFQPVLETVDAFGNPTTTGLPATLPVVVGLTNGSGVLLGTTQYDIGTGSSNGVVTFDDLAISAAGTGNQLTASVASTAVSKPVPGAVLWLDAGDPSTLMTNGTRVQAWKNKGTGGAGVSGTNLWFTQYTPALQPWLTNKLNGKPVITFSKNGNGYGTGCTWLGNVGQNSYTNSGSQMTYFVVARQLEDSIGWQGAVSFSASGQTDGQGTAGVVVLADGSQSAPYPYGIQRNHPGTPMQADVAAPPVGTPFVWSFVDNAGTATLSVIQSTGLSAANAANIVNGISPYTYDITDVTVGGRLEPAPSTVDNGWDGDVAEVLVYNTALSSTSCAIVESYLTNKWFAAALPSLGSALSAPFTVQSPGAEPPRQSILGVTVNANASVTLNYAATPGFSYCLETTTNLSSPSWTIVAGSVTNATGNEITFVIPAAGGAVQRFYRTVSP